METRNLGEVRQDAAVGNSVDKTIVTTPKFKEKHSMYGKSIQETKEYHVYDEKNEANVGDTVLIMKTRPLSRTKR